tara:strand:+ start:127 stop:681 length:555 start_codon:yes stop_codon:yes gene_type:complete
VFSISLLFGCGDAEKHNIETQVEPPQKESQKEDVKSTTQKNKKEEPSVDKKEKSTSFDPLKGKSLYDICASNSLSLIKWSYQERQGKEECCSDKMTEEQKIELLCEMDWPSSDIPSCSSYDTMRNEIFAQYGRSFSTDKWKKYFEKISWYKPREDYKDEWLSDVALNNIKRLAQMKKKKQGCMD